MKTLFLALAFVAMAYAFDVNDIPPHMKDRLDHFILLKKQWSDKWLTMSDQERSNYEHIILSRLEHIPEIEHERFHNRIQDMSEETRLKLRDYLRTRFGNQDQNADEFTDEVEEIDVIVQGLPEIVRDKINSLINVRFQQATAYQVEEETDDEMDFPDVPDLIDIPDAANYSEVMDQDVLANLDEFLMKREDWKRKWLRLPDDMRLAFEQYISEHEIL